jgi:hypothetical protein
LAVAVAAIAAYSRWHASFPNLSRWGDVAFLGLFVLPLFMSVAYVAVPFWRARGLLALALALVVVTFAFDRADLPSAANISKLGAVIAVGFWFLGYFETVAWVTLVAFIVPWVDIWSVVRGPTKTITQHHENVFSVLSIALPFAGEPDNANIGLPDVLFFALFLGATVRFDLRPRLTFVGMVLSFAATFALTVALDLEGWAALPFLALGFLLPNADLLWRRLRPRGSPATSA